MKMRLNAIKFILVFVLSTWATNAVYGQLSKVHYIPPISISQEVGNNTPQEQWIYISTPSKSSVSYTITPIGSTSADFVVSNTRPMKHDVLSFASGGSGYDSQLIVSSNIGGSIGETGVALYDKGFLIEAEQPIYVSVRLASSAQAGALVSKGENGLGQEFLLGSFDNNGSNSNGLANFFSFLATEDDTDITITFPKTVSLENHSGSYPVEVKLNKNGSYVGFLDVSSLAGNKDGLLGAKITSNKPIVVNTGSASGTNSVGGGRDFGIDQILDTRFAGEEYIFVRGDGSDAWENVMLIPTESGTSIEINNNAAIPITNSYYIIEGDKYIGQSMYVKSDKPIVAYQSIGAQFGYEPNQGMFYVPPLSCSSRGDVDNIPLIDEIGTGGWYGKISIVAKTGSQVYVNSTLMSGGTPVQANNEYSTYVIDNLSDSTYSVQSDDELYVSYYSYSGAASSGSFFSGFVTEPLIQSNISASLLGTCVNEDGVSNSLLTTTSGFDSYTWEKLVDETTDSHNIESNAKDFEPTSPGKYRLIGTLNCFPEKQYVSDYITVSLCPSDFDSDGIPDTIDLDTDNDGILNSFESLGNGTIDLSDPLNPLISLPNNPSNSIESSAVITPTGASISGSPTGEFSSEIQFTGIDEKTTYTLNSIIPSNEPFNIRIREVGGVVDNEFETITLSVSPATENITLIDPGERLLVDNGGGFKRVPSGGVSGNQIKFIYNSTPLDASRPYEILGVNITGVELFHELSASATKNALLNLQIDIIDYRLDTDGDGDIDAYDNDSDDDNCNDMIEAGHGQLTEVVNSFYDSNNPDTNIDIRGRFVFNDYTYSQPPLDNDNNSIFDFQEAGTPATLAKNFATTSAVRCEGESLTLTLETPDSDSVLWEVDTDADGLFEPAAPLGKTSDNGEVYEFKIDAVTTALDQAVFRARLSKKTYACTTDTELFTLTVNDNTTKPNLEPLTVVCYGATVGDLNVADVVWYAAATGGSPLADNVVLAHNTPYFAASVVNGCVGELRSETKVVVNDPVVSTVSGNTTFCAQESIILSLDTNKILPSPDDFARINNLVYIENAQGPVQYDNGYYYTQQGIKSGVQPITWPQAKALGESIVGATMYIINDATEEEAVYQGLQQMGLTGSDSVAFWLGLFQDQSASDYSEPDGGWYWVDGTPLSYKNWWTGEPNDYPSDSNNGEEDYGQFEFGNNGKFWNDMSLTTAEGQSYPLFEYKAQTQIEWFTLKDGVSTPIAGATNSSQLEVSLTETTEFFVRVTTNSVVCDSEPFTISIIPLPTANAVTNPIEICVDNNNGTIASADLKGDFDLTLVEETILGSQSDTNHTVAYYTTSGGAENEVSAAKILTPNAYTNTSNPQTIYYRVTNTDTNCASEVAELTIKANPLPPSITIPDIVICDDLNSGSDLDGILRFDLSLQNATIEALAGSSTQYTISYHETLADAEANANAITQYTTVASDNRLKNIVVRLEDNTTGCVRTDNNLNLVVAELPPNITIPDVVICDDLNSGSDLDGILRFDLSLQNATIEALAGSSTQYTISYHETLADAEANANAITQYTTVASDNRLKNIVVRLEDNTTGCVRTDNNLNLVVAELPPNITIPDVVICDDLDSGSDLDGILRFDLSLQNATIEALAGSSTQYTISYHETLADAEANANAITQYTTVASDNRLKNIVVRLEDNTTGCVRTDNNLNLVVAELPPNITIPDVVICDDLNSGSDLDGILRFDLSLQNATIEALAGSSTQYTISYHETLADAEANANAITQYTTVASDNRLKNIVVRLEDNTTGCVRTDNNLNLVVAELPTINQYTFEREQCDTDTDGIVQDNLTLYNEIFSINHTKETFTYYRDSSHNDEILNPSVFLNVDSNGNAIPDLTVYVKIENDNGCVRTLDPATGELLTINIKVRASGIKNTFLKTYYTCLDPSVKTNTGIAMFDKSVFTDLKSELIVEHSSFANNNVTIQFYENESDAASKVNPIDTSQDYVNTTPDRQEIWAAVDANGFTETTCLGLKQVAHFIVEPLAVLHPVTIPSQCDGDSPLDTDSQDGRFPFDTSTVMAQLLLTQNPNDYEITFYDQNDTVISTNGFPAVYDSPSQTIRVVVENNPSRVAPACYQEASFELTVDDSPEIGSYTLPVVCDNDDGTVDGFGVFDTSTLNTELLSGQPNMEIRFLQRDVAGNETILGARLPNPFTTQTATVVAQIYNPINTGCVAEEYITFQVNENPVFDLPENLVFCQNLGFDTIYLTNPKDVYRYSWARNGAPIPDQTAQDLIITQGGTYTVTGTNPVTGCATSKTVEVYESEIALFDSDDITVFDLTGDGTNRIEINNTPTAMGIGDYAFKLNDSPYQDSPLFENVPPGIHTVYVNDKNGCGEVSLDISVIGYSFYFTPNGDGVNDTWQILGVNATFQSSSLIYIFDRHGRLMAQIPTDSDGWDGSYNGTAMPADDYWFRVKLEDGRSFTGHFSLVR